jgi:hypothetical protein
MTCELLDLFLRDRAVVRRVHPDDFEPRVAFAEYLSEACHHLWAAAVEVVPQAVRGPETGDLIDEFRPGGPVAGGQPGPGCEPSHRRAVGEVQIALVEQVRVPLVL